MPANKSESKIRVTKLFGGGGIIGVMTPQAHMRVKNGIETFWIKNLDSGNYTVDLALSSGGTVVKSAYPHDLSIDATIASGYGWPTSPDSVKFGHSGVFPNGVPTGVGSGISYLGGNGSVYTFGR